MAGCETVYVKDHVTANQGRAAFTRSGLAIVSSMQAKRHRVATSSALYSANLSTVVCAKCVHLRRYVGLEHLLPLRPAEERYL